jgi:DNA-binding XRE family transcriptional regulator
VEHELKRERYLTLRGARINVGLTLEQAAQKLGISKYSLSNYEKGRSQLPLSVAWKMKPVYRLRSIEELSTDAVEGDVQ